MHCGLRWLVVGILLLHLLDASPPRDPVLSSATTTGPPPPPRKPPTSSDVPPPPSVPTVTPWVQAFCRKAGHEFYSDVPLSFIKDPVTTATICDTIDSPYVDAAIKLLNGDATEPSELVATRREATAVAAVAERLYALLHGRYLVTYDGLRSVRAKYDAGVYGQCPRVYCRGHPLLPVGLHDRPKQSTVKCFCPKCRDLYHPPSPRHRGIDGVAFGTTVPHLLLQRMPEVCPARPKDSYVPRIFGFELHDDATELRIYRGDVRGSSSSSGSTSSTSTSTSSLGDRDRGSGGDARGDNPALDSLG